MSNDDQLEFKIGEDEQAADVEVNDETGEAKLQTQEQAPIVEQASNHQEEELEQYSDKVKKRIDKMTARLREAQKLGFDRALTPPLTVKHKGVGVTSVTRLAEAVERISQNRY